MRGMKHGSYHTILIATMLSFLAGGAWMWFGFASIALGAVIFDFLLPLDEASHADADPRLANLFLYLMLPLLYFSMIFFNWQMSEGDWLSIGAGLEALTGWNILAGKALQTEFDVLGAYMSLGILIASGGTTVAHELVHRVWSPASMAAGRWLLAPTLDTSFSIEHVHGHHARVATHDDPASARRGENVFRFALRSTIGALAGAWKIEKERLRKRAGTGPWNWKNAFLRGQLMSLAVALMFVSAQGSFGWLSFLIIAVYGKFVLELINFIEHYGLCRLPGTAVESRHSWNCSNRFSLWYLFNLPRHSHHHLKGHLPYWKLQSLQAAPHLPFGYMQMLLLALIPPLFRRVMREPLRSWDETLATPAERAFIVKS